MLTIYDKSGSNTHNKWQTLTISNKTFSKYKQLTIKKKFFLLKITNLNITRKLFLREHFIVMKTKWFFREILLLLSKRLTQNEKTNRIL